MQKHGLRPCFCISFFNAIESLKNHGIVHGLLKEICMSATTRLENTLVLQGFIEGLTPQQVLVRDGLMQDVGLSNDLATSVVKGEISAEEASAVHCSAK
jgi:hypothetical protein